MVDGFPGVGRLLHEIRLRRVLFGSYNLSSISSRLSSKCKNLAWTRPPERHQAKAGETTHGFDRRRAPCSSKRGMKHTTLAVECHEWVRRAPGGARGQRRQDWLLHSDS